MLRIESAEGLIAITVTDRRKRHTDWKWKEEHTKWWGAKRKAGWYKPYVVFFSEEEDYLTDEEMCDHCCVREGSKIYYKPLLTLKFQNHSRSEIQQRYATYKEAVSIADTLAAKHMVNVIRIGE